MDDYSEAKAWMDIKQFNDASETDGNVWIMNLWLAVNAELPPGAERPRWFNAATLRYLMDKRASELGTLVKRPGIQAWRERSFKSVSALSPSSIDYYYSDVWPPLIADNSNIEKVDTTPFDERTDAFNKQRAFASIDLHHTDERILADFKQWLEITREKLKCAAPSEIKTSYLRRLKKHQVLPYIWLWAWQLKNSKKLTYPEQAKILFPNDQNDRAIDTNDKLKKSTRPLVEELACIIDGQLNMNNIGVVKLQNCGAHHRGIKQI